MFGWYIRLLLDWTLGKACLVRMLLLSTHSLLYYIVDVVRVRFVENGWILATLLSLSMSMGMVVMMVSRGAM